MAFVFSALLYAGYFLNSTANRCKDRNYTGDCVIVCSVYSSILSDNLLAGVCTLSAPA